MSNPGTTDDADEQTPDEVLWTAVGVEAGLGVLAIALGVWIGPSARDLIPSIEHWPAIVGGIGLGIVATVPLLLLIAVIKRIDHPAIHELESLGEHALVRAMLKLGPAELLAISLCAGVGEELLFRGWLMPMIAGEAGTLSMPGREAASAWWSFGGWLASDSDWSVNGFLSWWSDRGGSQLTIALVISSLAFGMVHPITRVYVAITGMIGLYFGLLLIVTGNLLIPIVAHALYDAIQLWTARREALAATD